MPSSTTRGQGPGAYHLVSWVSNNGWVECGDTHRVLMLGNIISLRPVGLGGQERCKLVPSTAFNLRTQISSWFRRPLLLDLGNCQAQIAQWSNTVHPLHTAVIPHGEGVIQGWSSPSTSPPPRTHGYARFAPVHPRPGFCNLVIEWQGSPSPQTYHPMTDARTARNMGVEVRGLGRARNIVAHHVVRPYSSCHFAKVAS